MARLAPEKPVPHSPACHALAFSAMGADGAQKMIDLTGKRFFRWTVIKEIKERRKGRIFWECLCDCGTRKEILGTSLSHGGTKSCGCYRNEEIGERSLVDLSGKNFGRLTAINRIEKDQDNTRKWKCVCCCGNEVFVSTGHLMSGHTKSCGCYKRDRIKETQIENLAGKRFGLLVVIGEAGRKNRKVKWNCICDCGNTSIALGTSLIVGGKHSCGCLRTGKRKGRTPFRTEELRKKVSVWTHSYRARKNNAPGSFTKADIDNLYVKQKGCCAACKTKLFDHYHRDHIFPLVLGGDNSIFNIQLLCEYCNLSKLGHDPIDWAKKQGRLL